MPKKGGTVHYPLVVDTRSLLWMANQNSITPHVWTSRAPHLDNPDLCVFDLDPMKDEPEVLRDAALAVRDLLHELGLESWVKTSGSKGFHIVVPIDGKCDWREVAAFGDTVGKVLVDRHPEQLTQEFAKVDRKRSHLRRHRSKLLRRDIRRRVRGAAQGRAPISAPCTWEEVASGVAAPRTFTLRGMARRIDEVGDLWSDMPGQSLDQAGERLARL